MDLSCVRVGRRRIAVLAGLAGISASLIIALPNSAEAARRKRSAGGEYSPPYADMVVDVKSGRVLRATNEDALRHPASVTKVMTLYLLFEQLDRGRLALETPLRISANAARQAPSKLGLPPGSEIEVEDAIKALVTKSANDIAVVIAENLAGSEETFAELMTRKARELGMSQTVYRNASGLPDPEQVTTARDLTVLARAIQDRFPKYYRYFQTRVFNYAGRSHRNHNKLLGRVEGVDGIKTGFTNASGFNLVTNVRTDDRHIVGVVLGGRSGPSRDRIMASLIQTNLPARLCRRKDCAGNRRAAGGTPRRRRRRGWLQGPASECRDDGGDRRHAHGTCPQAPRPQLAAPRRRLRGRRKLDDDAHFAADALAQRRPANPTERTGICALPHTGPGA